MSSEAPTIWPGRSADAEAVLDDLVFFIRSYVVLNDDQAVAVALWAVHAHAAEAAEFTPYIVVTSAEKRSGKTLLLDLLGRIVPRPLAVANTSVAALFRSIEDEAPTLLFDEVDAVFTRNGGDREQELRGVLNAGFRRGPLGTVLRTVGPTHTPKHFPVFCPKVLAGIGELPDTITDRSIVIRMKRKASTECVQRMRSRDVAEPAGAMRSRLADLAARNVEGLTDTRPELPDALDDRAADIWEPLLAIADLAGPRWSARARAVALALSAGRDGDGAESWGVRLLADVRALFDDGGLDRLGSADLARELNGIEEAPWGGFGQGVGITPRAIARLLKPYEIVPTTIKLADGTTAKGYRRERLAEAFERYLSRGEGPSIRNSVTSYMGSGLSAEAHPSPAPPGYGYENRETPHGDREVTELRIDGAETGIQVLHAEPGLVIAIESAATNGNGNSHS